MADYLPQRRLLFDVRHVLFCLKIDFVKKLDKVHLDLVQACGIGQLSGHIGHGVQRLALDLGLVNLASSALADQIDDMHVVIQLTLGIDDVIAVLNELVANLNTLGIVVKKKDILLLLHQQLEHHVLVASQGSSMQAFSKTSTNRG